MKAIRIEETGGPEVMRLEEIETPVPRQGEVLLKVAAAGINFADLSQRQGTYLTRTRTPLTLGMEVAGTVEAHGPGVSSPPVGTRVVALGAGGYAEYTRASVNTLIPIPETLDFAHAAAFPVQGITAYQLLRESVHLQKGENVLIHAAAGGVGTLAVQLAKLMGAGKIIATASSESKLDLARRLGADVTINYSTSSWPDQVRAATNGRGVDCILEMVGGDVTMQSLQCLNHFGRMVVYGAASGQVEQFAAVQLMYKNQTVTGYWLTAWMSQRPERIAIAAHELMQYLANGQLQIIVGASYPLAEAAEAHRAIANRETTGKVVLMV